jgi:nitrate/nitrite transport system substrate-binding protein
MKELGQSVPATGPKKIKVMGRDFDPAEPEAYVNSFAIKRI